MDGTTASGWTQGVGTLGSVTSQDDAARFSKVLKFTSGGRFDRSFSARSEKAFSFWFKHELHNHSVVLWATTSAGARRIVFKTGTGTDGYVSSEYLVHLGTGVLDGNWHRIERDLSAIVAAQTPGVTYTSTNAVSVWSSRCYVDDMRFSNTVTVEHNVLGGGVVGHILRNRSTNATTGAKTDRWFHYDQVGSVISESDAAGALAQTHHQDAFGNTQAAWNTGLWGGDKAGWHHNTKELDGDTGLVYMYQRWYSAETGTFMSSAPYRVMKEHRYGFVKSMPTRLIDPDGRWFRYSPPMESLRIGGQKCPPINPKNPCSKSRHTSTGGWYDSGSMWCSEGASSSHPGAAECFREIVPLGSPSSIGAQCCYDKGGALITSGPGAGTLDFIAPAILAEKDGTCVNGYDRLFGHFHYDYIPYVIGF